MGRDTRSRGPTRPGRRYPAQSGDQASFLPPQDLQTCHCARKGGALCLSNARLPRTPPAEPGFPSTLPRVTPARPAQGGAAALPTRCLTVSADGGGGMRAESGPGRARTSAPTRAASDWLSLAELRRRRAERGRAWTGRGYGRSPVRKLRLRPKLANSCHYLASASSSTKGANLLGSCP